MIIKKFSALVVDRLLRARHPVIPVRPTSFTAARPRWGASGAKSDPGDGFKLADYLRTDGHRLHWLEPAEYGLRDCRSWCGNAMSRYVSALRRSTSSAPRARRTGPIA